MKLSFSLSFLERKRNSLLCNWRLAWYPRVCVSILKKEMIYTRIFSFLPKSSFCFPCVYNGCRLAHKNVYNIFSSSYIIIKKNLSTGRLRLLIEVIMSYHEWVNDESSCWKKKHVIIIHFSFLHTVDHMMMWERDYQYRYACPRLITQCFSIKRKSFFIFKRGK